MSLRRRELVRRGAAAAGAALAVSLTERLPERAAAQSGDREVLEGALALELRLAGLYEELAQTAGRGAAQAEVFAAHCREHARGLRTSLANRGARPQSDGGGAPLPSPTVAAAADLETEAIAVYYGAHEGFGDLAFLPTLTSIMANHGQHLAILRQELGRQPATLAFETGGVE
ncbi:MAG TPA: ferritin-like domain-containing protein [Thermoleophilaceae bacterium]|nr:ferritin-like domain-containing protein [Thermoleophilaceae bacterium]